MKLPVRLQQRIAYHEAGHAVALIALRQRFRYATIIPRGNQAGHVRGHAITPSVANTKAAKRFLALVRGRVVVAVAGPIAEAKYRKRSIRMDADGDAQQAISLAETFAPKEHGAAVATAVVLGRSIVLSYWPDVCRVAGALVKHGTLTEKEIRALVTTRSIQTRTAGRKMRVLIMQGEKQIGKSERFHL